MPFRIDDYDSQTVALMGHAYDSAINDLNHSDVSVTDSIKATIALRILELVDGGERDPNRLLQSAMDAASRVKTIIAAAKGMEAAHGASSKKGFSRDSEASGPQPQA
jgi:hypothetical protein